MGVSASFGSRYHSRLTFGLSMMTNEKNTSLKPPRGRESGWRATPGSTPGNKPGTRRPNAPRGRPQPIDLEVVHNPNILTNLKWQDERGMWLHSI